jgi:hypothetical protein
MSHDRITDHDDEDLLAHELGLLAHDHGAPQSTVDVARAVHTGRLVRRRRRRVRTALAALALAAAVAVGMGVIPGIRHGSDAQHHGATSQRDPLTVAADFTWLPKGFTERSYWINSAGAKDRDIVRAEATSPVPSTPWPPPSADVLVYPKGVDPAVHEEATDWNWKYRIQAPDVNGRSAYWMSETAGRLDGFGVLRWQTADGRWAQIRFMYWDPKGGNVLVRMAEGVVAQDRAVPMPFYIRGLPAGFTVTTATFDSGHSRTGSPQWGGAVALQYEGRQVFISSGGVEDGKPAATGTDHGVTTVCSVAHAVETCAQYWGRPGEKAPAFGTVAGLQSLLRLVHPLGADPADWTTDVLR